MEPFSSTFTIDVRRLRVLRELAQRGTVGATAKALALTPSAISQQLSSLSREVGVPLLEPQGRRVRLTTQARILLEHGALVDAELERARADLEAFAEGAVGRVAIGAFATAISGLVAPAVARIRRERPRLIVSVEEIDAPESLSQLDRGELDLVISVDYQGGPARGDRRYWREELLDDHLLVALPQTHPLAAQRSVDLLSLEAEPWIVGGRRGPCQAAALAACAAAGFTPELSHHVDDWNALLELVAAGCGVGLVPRLALAGTRPAGVALRPPAGRQRPCRHLFAALRAGAERSPVLAPVLGALLSLARARAAAKPTSRGRRARSDQG
ncbi:MAG TPA: LysR family transcriptional regulator [Anaeromyxobacter sp.]|nr:LysR family transcriptional regulator [Anaeromyxobacter sp.]